MGNPVWFDSATLAGFGGASLAVTVLVNTARKLAGKRWSAVATRRVVFVICLLIACVVVLLESPGDLLSWCLMPLNACLLFCTALGMNVVGGKATASGKHGAIDEAKFFDSWIGK